VDVRPVDAELFGQPLGVFTGTAPAHHLGYLLVSESGLVVVLTGELASPVPRLSVVLLLRAPTQVRRLAARAHVAGVEHDHALRPRPVGEGARQHGSGDDAGPEPLGVI